MTLPESNPLHKLPEEIKERLTGSFTAQSAADDPVLAGDPSYHELTRQYQNGNWSECNRLMELLLQNYPDRAWLHELSADIGMRMMLQRMETEAEKDRRREKLKKNLTTVGFVLLTALIGFFLIRTIVNNYIARQQAVNLAAAQQQAARLDDLSTQANALLQAGNADLALGVIQEIQLIDPAYAELKSLNETANQIMIWNQLYADGLTALNQQDFEKARSLFEEIQRQNPNYRDIANQLRKIDQYNALQALIAQTNAAFLKKQWAEVITGYEELIRLNGGLDSERSKQQLLTSYLSSVITILSKQEQTFDEIDQAGEYYRKAVALIPQSRIYSQERGNLQQISVQLLAAKYTQTARRILADPNQTERTVNRAVDYLTRAFELTPEEAQLKVEIDKANLYLAGLQAFVREDWENAAQNLTVLTNFDSNYPNGMARHFLYEAHLANGQKYYIGGFYRDALASFQAAETIAWQDANNRLRLYEAQENVGATLGRLDDYKSAAGYFKYAVSLLTGTKGMQIPAAQRTLIAKADENMNTGAYYEAFQIYAEVLKSISGLIPLQNVEVRSGDNLVYIASLNASTLHAIRKANNLPDSLQVQYNQTLLVPQLPK